MRDVCLPYINGYGWVPRSRNRIPKSTETKGGDRAGPHSVSAPGFSVPPSRTSTEAEAADGFSETVMSWPMTMGVHEGHGKETILICF